MSLIWVWFRWDKVARVIGLLISRTLYDIVSTTQLLKATLRQSSYAGHGMRNICSSLLNDSVAAIR